MAYADRNVSGNRVVAIVIVSVLVAVMGYAFVTGLTYKYVKAVSEKLKTFDVEEAATPRRLTSACRPAARSAARAASGGPRRRRS